MSAPRLVGLHHTAPVAGAGRLRAVVEQGRRRSFATAVDWPGWSRSGRTPEEAVEALLAYAPRYGPVAERAGHPLPAPLPAVDVVESLPGDATTDFGAPGAISDADRRPVDAVAARRLAELVSAAWDTLDEVAAAAPPVLTKGPRGGGRDTAAVVAHVAESEAAYGRKIGVGARHDPPGRAGILAVLGAPSDGSAMRPGGWPARFAAGRIAWHALDHAWEIEDRTPT